MKNSRWKEGKKDFFGKKTYPGQTQGISEKNLKVLSTGFSLPKNVRKLKPTWVFCCRWARGAPDGDGYSPGPGPPPPGDRQHPGQAGHRSPGPQV